MILVPGEKVVEAKKLLQSQTHGILSTQAADLPGYPFGTYVPYAVDAQGRPVFLLSALAQHSKNLSFDPKCSLAVHEDVGGKDPQEIARLTWVGECRKIERPEPDVKERYYKLFPSSEELEKMDFSFYRLELLKIRWIGGFGKASWIDPSEYNAHA